jgi:hypothetical protein
LDQIAGQLLTGVRRQGGQSQRERLDAGGTQCGPRVAGQRRAALQEFAGGGVDDVAKQARGFRAEFVGIGHVFAEEADEHLGASPLGQHGPLQLLERDFLEGEEQAQDIHRSTQADSAQQSRCGEFALLVDDAIDDVMDVDEEFDPGSPGWNDPRRVKLLAVGVDGLFEHDPRRAVELRDDDPLGAVDDEGAVRREQRQLAQIDLLLQDVLRPPILVAVFPDDEPQRRA